MSAKDAEVTEDDRRAVCDVYWSEGAIGKLVELVANARRDAYRAGQIAGLEEFKDILHGRASWVALEKLDARIRELKGGDVRALLCYVCGSDEPMETHRCRGLDGRARQERISEAERAVIEAAEAMEAKFTAWVTGVNNDDDHSDVGLPLIVAVRDLREARK